MSDERVWISVPMPSDMRVRIKKAAARNDMTVAQYMRMAVVEHMRSNQEWSLPGPRKGST